MPTPFQSEHAGDDIDEAIALILQNLMSAAEARDYLQLGDSATRDVGTIAGTVMAGDDARVTNAVLWSDVGVASGVAPLDSNEQVPLENLPPAVAGGMHYAGTWNANTNTPTLASGVGTTGDYYVVSVAGTTTIDTENDWAVKDWIVFNGTIWEKIDNTEKDATGSVNGNVRLTEDLGGTASSPQVVGLQGEALPSPAANRFVKWNAAGAALEGVTYGDASNTICQGNDSRLSAPYRNLWIGAEAMVARTTNGAATGSTESATNKIMAETLDFDGATQEFAQFKIAMPDDWDRSTVKFKIYWMPKTGASAADTVEWGIKAGAYSNDDALDAALGSEVTVGDTVIAVGDVHVTAASGAVTVGGSPALGDLIWVQISRNPAGTDDMTEDALLLGVMMQYREGTLGSAAAW